MVLINGKPGDSVNAQDRGLHYGDGVFETIAVHQGKLLCWDKHYARLNLGCQRLNIPCPEQSLLHEESRQVISDNKAVIKIILTRGAGGRGYNPHGDFESTRIVAGYDWPEYPDRLASEGVKVRICNIRLGSNPELAGIKHLNRLEQVMARGEWTDAEISEGLMLDQGDNIIEGTMSNIFIVNQQTLVTPDLSRCGIQGVMRQCVIELAPKLGIDTEIRDITLADLTSAEEAFLCNSTFGIWPVRDLDGQKINMGPNTQKIREMLLQNGLICE